MNKLSGLKYSVDELKKMSNQKLMDIVDTLDNDADIRKVYKVRFDRSIAWS